MKNIIITLTIISFAMLYSMCDDVDMYSLAKYGPKPDKIYIFIENLHTGDLGGYDGAQDKCEAVYLPYANQLKALNIKPFLSTSYQDIRDLVPNVFWDVPVHGVALTPGPPLIVTVNPTSISNSWDNLWDGSIDNPFINSITLSTNWWSGSNSNGTASGNTCNDWTNGLSSSLTGTQGNNNSNTDTWITYTIPPNGQCNTNSTLLCIAY